MSLDHEKITRIVKEKKGIELEFGGSYLETELALRYFTSEVPSVAVYRLTYAIARVGIPPRYEEAAFEHMLDVQPDWQKASEETWIEVVKQWWRENHVAYGYEGLPRDLEPWKDEP